MLTSKEHIINRKIIIIQADLTQTAFAKKAGISRIGLYKALTGQTKNKNMHTRICDALGVAKEVFWPEFYGVDAGTDIVNTVSHDATINDQAVGVN